ncbi:MAG: polyribonucleotide nucleotidyltransferase [Chloroflexota bacterium]
MADSGSFECEVGGRSLVIETGKLAGQASGAVTVRYGETVILATVVISSQEREGVDFLPLTVDYEERLYAVGKIPGGFIRREGRPTEEAVLAGRLTDRTIRPLMPKEWRRDIQVIITVLSVDQENAPDVLGIIGSSAALLISGMVFAGPVSAVHVGYLNGELVLNPALPDMEESLIDVVVSSTREKVVMLETGAKEAPEDIVLQAIAFGHQANQNILDLQEKVREKWGKPKIEVPVSVVNHECVAAVDAMAAEKVALALKTPEKARREQILTELKKQLLTELGERFGEAEILHALDKKTKTEMRTNILKDGRRVSGRALTEIRPISCAVGILPRTHGSALFTRGLTQVLNITTLGPVKKEQQLEGLGLEETKRFIHHYNMPPFSTGEAKRIGTPGRREIGHGALAGRALSPVIPKDEDFPYTLRLVSEVLSSSGSTSMASVCSGSMSLMDAGIPITAAVAGISIGLVTGDDGNYVLLTDIEGTEDFNGDMDFKVAGTRQGITAVQMDTKLQGLSLEIIEKAVRQAREARLIILDIMEKTIAKPRAEMSPYAPRMYKIKINQDKIGAVIGSGGKTIRAISEQTKATIDIENDGTVIIGSPDEAAARRTISIIEGLTKEIEVGAVYTGRVTRIMNFGAMVEILPGKEGLIHISELADYRVNRVEDIVKVGDEVTVQVTEVDNLGRVNLSRKAVFEKQGDTNGDNAKTEGTADYPFKSSRDTRPPRSPQPRFSRGKRPYQNDKGG